MADVIEAEGLEKRFGQTRALAGAGFSARRGTVLANACGAGVRPHRAAVGAEAGSHRSAA